MKELTILSADDAETWMEYVSYCIQEQMSNVNINRLKANDASFKKSTLRKSNAFLVIFSPDLLTWGIENKEEFKELRHVVASADRTIGGYCGLTENDISHLQLENFHKWSTITFEEDADKVEARLKVVVDTLNRPRSLGDDAVDEKFCPSDSSDSDSKTKRRGQKGRPGFGLSLMEELGPRIRSVSKNIDSEFGDSDSKGVTLKQKLDSKAGEKVDSVDDSRCRDSPQDEVEPAPAVSNIKEEDSSDNEEESNSSLLPKKPDKPPKSPLGRFEIFPRRVQHGDDILIMLREPSTETSLSVTLENRKFNQRGLHYAKPKNTFVFVLKFDMDDMSPGDIQVFVFVNKKNIGHVVIKYLSDLDILSETLTNALNPVALMCEALGIDHRSTKSLDRHLTTTLMKHTPSQLAAFHSLPDTINEGCDSLLPTLLHFAAKYGLPELARYLITLPGAYQAYSQENCQGDSPLVIAQKENYDEIEKCFEQFETAVLEYHADRIYEDMTGIKRPSATTIDEDIYGFGTYALMKPGSHYDFPRMIVRRVDADLPEESELPEPDENFMQSIGGSQPHLAADGDYGNTAISLKEDDIYVETDNLPTEIPEPKKKPQGFQLPPPPKPIAGSSQKGTTNEKKNSISTSGRSNLFDQTEEERSTIGASASSAELISIQKDVRDGILSIDDAQKMFEDWNRRFKKGATSSLRTRKNDLDQIRAELAQQNKKGKGGPVIIKQSPGAKMFAKVDRRAPAPLPRPDLQSELDVSNKLSGIRTPSTLSSGSSRTSNLSDSGVPEEMTSMEADDDDGDYMGFGEPQNLPPVPPGRKSSISPPPPRPPRLQHAPPPNPSGRSMSPSHRPRRHKPRCDVVQEIENLGPPPGVPSRKF